MRTLGRFLSVVLVVAAAIVLAAWGTAEVKAGDRSTTSLRIGAFAVNVPQGLGRYHIRGGIYMKGTRPPVIGVLATDDRRAHLTGGGFAKWSQLSSSGPPANKVALSFQKWLVIGPDPPASALRLHLPLSLDQPWFREHLSNGRQGYRWGYLRFRRQFYAIRFWSGRAAPPRDRAAVLSALRSIHLTR
jgi:hypothetical protein